MKNSAPWHARAWQHFVGELLPGLLEKRLPLSGYHVEEGSDAYSCQIDVTVTGAGGDITVRYADVPCPDERGLFFLEGAYRVVVALAEGSDVEKAEIRCLDVQMLDFVAARLGEAPQGLEWDKELLYAFLPLDRWLREFHREESSQYLQTTNWIDMHTHMRRVFVNNPDSIYPAGQMGRFCPLCLPEGHNLPRVREVAQGAEIRDGHLVVIEESPQATLGLQTSMIPFLQHDDANRALMGGNMMRQWMVPLDPDMPMHANASFTDYQTNFRAGAAAGGETEEALVQTGCEPDNPYFWAGHNLLTAYITWDGNCFEDGIVLSESAAEKMACPQVLEPGDKISNRHGTKGVISQILPDEQMPKMEDGTPVELICSIGSLISRLNFGQVREAVLGRIARAEGKPAFAPAFAGPSSDELKARLEAVNLPPDGMEQLSLDGENMAYRSSVGWVYWGCTLHVARRKIQASTGAPPLQALDEYDYYALRQVEAYENIREFFHTQVVAGEDVAELAARASRQAIDPATPPSPRFADVMRRLCAGGIGLDMADGHLTFSATEPEEPVLNLAQPIPHPWSGNWQLSRLGLIAEAPGQEELVAANERMASLLRDQAPESLRQQAQKRLEIAVADYLDGVLTREHMRFSAEVAFSGYAVLAPGADLRFDQVGLPEEVAWTLFRPHLERELGAGKDVESRSAKAAKVLDRIMADAWVVVYRRPGFYDVSIKPFIAFHPVREAGKALRLPAFACGLMDADFDGDGAAVFLPLSQEAQREAGERLTLLHHVRQNPQMIRTFPLHDAQWGLAFLSQKEEGRAEIKAALAVDVELNPMGIYSKKSIGDALYALIERDGVEAGLFAYERLFHIGFAAARRAGGSLSPFMGLDLKRPPQPQGNDVEQWDMYQQELQASLAEQVGFSDDDMGAVLLAINSGARGSHKQLGWYLGGHGALVDPRGRLVAMEHGLVEGKTAEEFFAQVSLALNGLATANMHYAVRRSDGPQEAVTDGFYVLARARRALRPGMVFPRAVDSSHEQEPLVDIDSRLFVGLSASE